MKMHEGLEGPIRGTVGAIPRSNTRFEPQSERSMPMSVVKINAISVPEGKGPELEARFAARKHAVDSSPGFEGFQLLRPVAGGDQYFVYTQWATKADFENWKANRTSSHESTGKAPVSEQANLLEFEVVDLGE